MSSKFSNLLSQARNRPHDEDEPEVEQGSELIAVPQQADQQTVEEVGMPSTQKRKSKPTKASLTSSQKKAVVPMEREGTNTIETSLRGRPRTGKRSDPNYTQITAYITKNTHRDVKLALLQEDKGRELSEIIEELLAAWVKKQI